MSQAGRLLIVDDERTAVKNLEYVMLKEGYQVATASSGHKAMEQLAATPFDIVLTDLRMERMDGFGLLEMCRERYPDIEVIIITGFATLESAVEAMKRGAFSYIAKPFRLDEVRKVTAEAMEKIALKRENRQLKQTLAFYEEKGKIITQDPSMLKLIDFASQIAPTDCNVVVQGESGVGKELFARYLHIASQRAQGPFVAINCGAFNDDLLENELFGHVRGAFTGALGERKGLFEAAEGGTLFLDEFTEMSPAMQVKLLRVLQERTVRRLGETREIAVDVRVIGATNRDLALEVREGRLRQDLYYRLMVAAIVIPPLAHRKGDIPLLCHHFLHRFAQSFHKEVSQIAPEAMAILTSYEYPGNIRELANIIERGVAMVSGNVLEARHLPDDLRELNIRAIRRRDGEWPTLEQWEREYVEWIYEQVGGNQTQAAQILGIDRVSLWRRLKKYRGEV